MLKLRQSLFQIDPALLRVIADRWEIPAHVTDRTGLVTILSEKMTDPLSFQAFLTEPMRAALSDLRSTFGMMTTETFFERHGKIRVIGIRQILREKVWEHPCSDAEDLWYTGLIYRGNDPDTMENCVFLPEEIYQHSKDLLGSESFQENAPASLLIRPASPDEIHSIKKANDALLDALCLQLALKRTNKPLQPLSNAFDEEMLRFTECLVEINGFTEDPERIRKQMISCRYAALYSLFRKWAESEDYDELEENTHDFNVSGTIHRNRAASRKSILSLLSSLQFGKWWSASAFISEVEQKNSEFLRAEITDQTWTIRDAFGNNLNGRGSWYQLEGSYIRFLLAGPLFYLNITDIGYMDENKTIGGFRLTRTGKRLLMTLSDEDETERLSLLPNNEKGVPTVSVDGRINCGPDVPRLFRYQCGRYCDLEKVSEAQTLFRITPESLQNAAGNGLGTDAFLLLLKRFCPKGIPPTLEDTVREWKLSQTPARIYDAVILSLPNKEAADRFFENEKCSKFIIQVYNDTTMEIDTKGVNEIRRFLMENKIFVALENKEKK